MRAKKSGFTLVEILIVVVILGILAAIVVPQFTVASDDAKKASMKSDLQTIRSQIQLYKVQHNDNLPGTQGPTFVEAMTNTTNAAGALSGTDFGEYLYAFPENPYNNLATVGIGGTAGDNSHGWEYSTTTGRFDADDSNDHAAW